MKRSINLLMLSLIGFGLSIVCANGQQPSPKTNKYKALQATLEKWVDEGKIVGAELLILKDHEKVVHEAFGWSDIESGKQLQKGSIWTVMSMTKPFTATAIFMLIEDGLISLDTPIIDYIHDFKGNKEITIRHLLAQSSGDDGKHGNGGNNVLDFESLDKWINDWGQQRSGGTLGEFAYSNFNYGALAYIVEQVSGMPVEEFIKKRIIEPLKLKNTYLGFSPESTWAELVPGRYQWNESAKKYEKFWGPDQPQSWKFFTGALGLWMSAEDYATFIQLWINKGQYRGIRLLKEATVREVLKIQAKAHGEELWGHGYGWFVDEIPLVFRYGGSAGGIGIGYPDKNTVVIYLTHCAGGDHRSEFQNTLDNLWFPNDN